MGLLGMKRYKTALVVRNDLLGDSSALGSSLVVCNLNG